MGSWWTCCGTILLLLTGTSLSQNVDIGSDEAIQALLCRPKEGLYFPKDNNITFAMPPGSTDPRYEAAASSIDDRFGGKSNYVVIEVEQTELPDLSLAMELGRSEGFSTFNKYHRDMASQCIEALLDIPSRRDCMNTAALIRDRMNPYLWTFCMQVVLIHRNDTQTVNVPTIGALHPDKFVDGALLRRASQDSVLLPPEDQTPIIIPLDYTANDLEPEHRVAYFREDMGINIFHWTWHLEYPFVGPFRIVNKDRRAELFYYLHFQILGRYNFERLSVGLLPVVAFSNFRKCIEPGYFPKLDSLVASRAWPGRAACSFLKDISRPDFGTFYEIADLERWRENMNEAIDQGEVVRTNGSTVDLNNPQGIDVLANMMEASILSVNPNLYGDLHNLGHFAISLVHDPDGRHLESFGVMGDFSTAMRDPSFYEWHEFVDDTFRRHKETLDPYTVQELDFEGITVESISVLTEEYPVNELRTFWQRSDVELSRGLDVAPRGPLYAGLTHLQHRPFNYSIQVNNNGTARNGTVRIFLAPKFNEKGQPMPFREKKDNFIEMDRYVMSFEEGINNIQRSSTESSLTIPFRRTFRRLDNTDDTITDEEFNYCGCGWPQHMLVPRGNEAGFPAELFVMVSDYEDDKVDQPPPSGCTAGHPICGEFNRKYPDARSMGYPFDRRPRPGVDTISQFLTPNMNLVDVIIKFINRVELYYSQITDTTTPVNQSAPVRPVAGR